MAREYAKTNVTIWQDAEWRATPAPAQHLYMLMWTHPSLDYCGVLDWRPGRLAQFAAGLTGESIATAGACLQARQLIVVDDETEEALLRSWIRFDGLVGHDKLSVSMAKAFAGVASNKLRGVIVDELHKLREREPGLCGWQKPQVQDMLTQPRIPAKSLPVPSDPLSNPFSEGANTPPSAPASNPLSLSGSSGSSTPLHQHLHQQPQHQQQEETSSSEIASDPDGYAIRPEIEDLCRHLAARVRENGHKVTNELGKSWTTPCRLMLDRDGYTAEQIRKAIDWSTADGFWYSNIRSMATLREKYTTLRAQALQRPNAASAPAEPKRFVPPYEGDPDNIEAYQAHYAQWGKPKPAGGVDAEPRNYGQPAGAKEVAQ